MENMGDMEKMEKSVKEEDPEEQELDADEINECLCCCCICHCSTKKTEDLSCCGCFPMKCGVVTIGIITLVLFVALFAEVFYCILNESYDWWYVLVAAILLVPFFIACTFFVVFFSKDTGSSRGKLFVACQLIIISVSLVAIWNLCYIYFWYKSPEVMTGTPDQGYYRQSKKSFIVWSLFIATCIDFVYAYFLCVCKGYRDALKNPNEAEEEGVGFGSFGKLNPLKKKEEEEKKDEEKKDEEKKDEEKKEEEKKEE